MHFFMRFLILVWICVNASAANDEPLPTKATELSQTKVNEMVAPVENKIRDKRQLYVPTATPIFFDPQQPSNGGLLGLGGVTSNIPIVGTLVSGLPLLGNGQNLLGGIPGLGGLTSTLGNLGGGLGNFGQLGNIGGLGNLGLLGTAPSATNAASCPASQKLACRCESLIPIKPLGTRKATNADVIEILDQSIKRNMDGSTEIIAELSNGVIMYQKSRNLQVKEIEGYYTLKITQDRYLTIYYTINDADYTVRADVNSQPPHTNFEIENENQNLIGSF